MIAWGPAALWAAVLFFLSAQTDIPGARLLDWLPGADKLVHFLLYGALGALLARGEEDADPRLPHAVPVAAGVLYGASDEWHQSFVAGRHPSPWDWAADACGVGAGYWLFLSLRRRRDSRPRLGAN